MTIIQINYHYAKQKETNLKMDTKDGLHVVGVRSFFSSASRTYIVNEVKSVEEKKWIIRTCTIKQ